MTDWRDFPRSQCLHVFLKETQFFAEIFSKVTSTRFPHQNAQRPRSRLRRWKQWRASLPAPVVFKPKKRDNPRSSVPYHCKQVFNKLLRLFREHQRHFRKIPQQISQIETLATILENPKADTSPTYFETRFEDETVVTKQNRQVTNCKTQLTGKKCTVVRFCRDSFCKVTFPRACFEKDFWDRGVQRRSKNPPGGP